MIVNQYRKLLVSLGPVLVSGLLALQLAIGDGDLDVKDTAALAVAVLTALGVWASAYPQVKSAVAFAGAAATAWSAALTDGHVTGPEWVSILVAALAAIGVTVVTNDHTP